MWESYKMVLKCIQKTVQLGILRLLLLDNCKFQKFPFILHFVLRYFLMVQFVEYSFQSCCFSVGIKAVRPQSCQWKNRSRGVTWGWFFSLAEIFTGLVKAFSFFQISGKTCLLPNLGATLTWKHRSNNLELLPQGS